MMDRLLAMKQKLATSRQHPLLTVLEPEELWRRKKYS